MVTSICGSSSCGVIITATTPSSRPSRASTGVSGLAWNVRAMRPEMPRRGALFGTMSVVPVRGNQRLARCHRVGGDGLVRGQAGDHLDPVAVALAQAQLAQRQTAPGEHVDRVDFATR